MNIVIHRYDDTEVCYYVEFNIEDGITQGGLVTKTQLENCFSFGNETDYSLEEIWNQIPFEWTYLTEEYDESWVRGRVSVYDEIRQIKPLK